MNESEINLPTDDDDLPFVVKGRKRHLPPPEALKPPQQPHSPYNDSRTNCHNQALNGSQTNPISHLPFNNARQGATDSQAVFDARPNNTFQVAQETSAAATQPCSTSTSNIMAAERGSTAAMTAEQRRAPAMMMEQSKPGPTMRATEQSKVMAGTTESSRPAPARRTTTEQSRPAPARRMTVEQSRLVPTMRTTTEQSRPGPALTRTEECKTVSEQHRPAGSGTEQIGASAPVEAFSAAESQNVESRSLMNEDCASQDNMREDFDEDDDDAALFIPTDEESSEEIASPLQSSTGGVSCTPSSSRRALNTSASQKRSSRKRKKNTSSEEEDDASSTGSAAEHLVLSARVRDKKGNLIAQILARWWYCMDPWPPAGFDYKAELHRRKLKQVSFDAWEDEDDVDAQNFTKVYEITHFPGMYRDPKGNVVDLRPEEGKPCFANLAKLPENDLIEMLAKALQNQIKALDQSPYKLTDDPVVRQLQEELRRELRNLNTTARTPGRGKSS